jgi:hypothetical protein
MSDQPGKLRAFLNKSSPPGHISNVIGASVIPFASILLSMVPMWLSPITLSRERMLSEFSEGQHRSPQPRTEPNGAVPAQAAE